MFKVSNYKHTWLINIVRSRTAMYNSHFPYYYYSLESKIKIKALCDT